MSIAAKIGIELAERGLLPDAVIRRGIRKLCADRLASTLADDAGFAAGMRTGPVAPVPEAANEQHYEVPAAFFGLVLGHRRKYSGCYWPAGVEDLDRAEDAALEATCSRARLEDGMDILELGCGWGSLTLWMAERYPNARITAVSNSGSQRAFIMEQAGERGLENVRVITADMNDFDIDERFDRVVSVEMFEHMRNYEVLLSRVAGWLKADGRLFVHVFAHKDRAYEFEPDGASNWMGRHFFTGGIMPSVGLMCEFGRDLAVDAQWEWDGRHYQRTAQAWLERLDSNRARVMALFREGTSGSEAKRMYHRWRIFFMACAETFGYRGGSEWVVAHYLLSPVGVGANRVRAGEAVGV